MFGRKIFADVIKYLRGAHTGLGCALHLVTGVLMRRENPETRRQSHVNTEADLGGMWSQAKECPDAPGAGRGRKNPPTPRRPRACRGNTALLILHYQPLDCKAVRIYFCCFKALGWWSFVTAGPGALMWAPFPTTCHPDAPGEACTWPMSSASCWGWTTSSPGRKPAWGRPEERPQDRMRGPGSPYAHVPRQGSRRAAGLPTCPSSRTRAKCL